MRSTEPGCFRSCSWCLWKALNKEGCIGLASMTFGLAVQKFLKFSEELECAFDVVGKILMSRI